MKKKKKNEYSLPLPKNIEIAILVIILIIIVSIDVYFIKIIFPYFQDSVISRWSPMHGNASYSMRGVVIVFLDIFAFCILYSMLRIVAIKIKYKNK